MRKDDYIDIIDGIKKIVKEEDKIDGRKAEIERLRAKLDKVSQIIIDVWGKKELEKILHEDAEKS